MEYLLLKTGILNKRITNLSVYSYHVFKNSKIDQK